jgi:hypothetical protein
MAEQDWQNGRLAEPVKIVLFDFCVADEVD